MAKKKTSKKTARKSEPKPPVQYPVVTGTVEKPGLGADCIGVDVSLEIVAGPHARSTYLLECGIHGHTLSLNEGDGTPLMVFSLNELRPFALGMLEAERRIRDARGEVVAETTKPEQVGWVTVDRDGNAEV